jgi:hypothetical protein
MLTTKEDDAAAKVLTETEVAFRSQYLERILRPGDTKGHQKARIYVRAAMNNLLDRISEAWCKTMHPEPMWPAHGSYQCRVCFRKFPVAWEKPHNDQPSARTGLSQALAGEGR